MVNDGIEAMAVRELTEMTRLLGLEAQVEAAAAERGGFKLSVKSKDAARLIGHKGQTLEALELLLNRIVKCDDEEAAWVPVEVDGYSTGRTGGEPRRGRMDDETIQRFACMAQEAAKEVRHWRTPKRLGPLNPAERRAIHTALKDDAEVTTESVPAPEAGEKMKYVVVKLKE